MTPEITVEVTTRASTLQSAFFVLTVLLSAANVYLAGRALRKSAEIAEQSSQLSIAMRMPPYVAWIEDSRISIAPAGDAPVIISLPNGQTRLIERSNSESAFSLSVDAAADSELFHIDIRDPGQVVEHQFRINRQSMRSEGTRTYLAPNSVSVRMPTQSTKA